MSRSCQHFTIAGSQSHSRKPVNAFSDEFWEEFGSVFDKIGLEPDVRVVILASALPKLFSGGIDCTYTLNTLHMTSARVILTGL